jgi:small-conductance mechanosensitive channel
VKALMQKAFDQLCESEHGAEILPPFEMHGVTGFGDSAVKVRGRIKTRPGSQWAVGRAYNEIVKELFDEAGIEIPFPHLTLYMGEDKAGNAPPLRVRKAGEPDQQRPDDGHAGTQGGHQDDAGVDKRSE